MKTILALSTAAIALTAMQCGPRRNQPCDTVVVQEDDTAQIYAGSDNQVVYAKKDTVPKPYTTCLALYADTVSRPR